MDYQNKILLTPSGLSKLKTLNWTEKALVSMVITFDQDKGCDLSNKDLGSCLNMGAKSIANMLSKMRKLSYIQDYSFDGRNRHFGLSGEFRAMIGLDKISKSYEYWQKKEIVSPKTNTTLLGRHLYLVHDEVLDVFKIGKSNNPKSRLKSLQVSTSNKLTLKAVIKNEGHTESDVHKLLKSFQKHGEWFYNVQDVRDYFQNYYV